MKCEHCNGTGKVRKYFYEKTDVNKWEQVWGDCPCNKCNGTGKIEITNDEWRKDCSAEEFAKWIYDLIMHKGNTKWYEDLLDYREDTMDYRADYHLIEMWLKQPHNEKE